MPTRTVNSQTAMLEKDLSRRTAAEYKADIVEHMIAMSRATRPDVAMIDMQPEIEWQMWPYLIDFMIDVHTKLRLEPQTLFLATNIVNRYCSRRIVFRKHFQLVGATALWVASKYEDKKSRVPSLPVLEHMCCKAYQTEMFTQMEGHMLNTLDWTLGHCTVDTFLSACLSHGASPLLTNLTSYIAEITLYHREFIGSDPHLVARMIHLLSLHILSFYPSMGNNAVTPDEQLCLDLLYECLKSPSRTLSEKYAHMDRFQVSRLVTNYVNKQEQEQQRAAAAAAAAAPPAGPSSPGYAPLTPPQTFNGRYGGSASAPGSTFTPPNLSTGSSSSLASRTLPAEDSPLTARNAAAENLFGIMDSITTNVSVSPPTTPLDPPKRPFTYHQMPQI